MEIDYPDIGIEVSFPRWGGAVTFRIHLLLVFGVDLGYLAGIRVLGLTAFLTKAEVVGAVAASLVVRLTLFEVPYEAVYF